MTQDTIKSVGKNTLEWLRRNGAGCTLEGLALGVNVDSPFTVTEDKVVYNDTLLSAILLSVRVGTCGSVFLNVSLSTEKQKSWLSNRSKPGRC